MVNAPQNEAIVVGGFNNIEAKVFDTPAHANANDKETLTAPDSNIVTKDDGQIDIHPASRAASDEYGEKDNNDNEVIIVTGADAAHHLLPMRDDGDPALTFRSIFLATLLSGFQAVMYQIYQVCRPSTRDRAPPDTDSPPCLVQTDGHHHLRHLHRPHRLLPRQGVGRHLSPG